jgi:hypothetical protein
VSALKREQLMEQSLVLTSFGAYCRISMWRC